MEIGRDKVDKSANRQAYIPYQTIQNNLDSAVFYIW